MSIDAMKQALEALETVRHQNMSPQIHPAKVALRAAIEAAERQEPVAVKLTCDPYDEREGPWFSVDDCAKLNALASGTKLYTTPQPAILAGLEIQVIMDAVRCHGSRLNNDEILSMLAAAPKLENLR